MLGASKSISGFDPRSIPGCAIWLDGNDPTTFTPAAPSAGTTITAWLDKASGFSFTPGAIQTQSSNGTVLTPVGPTYVAGGGARFSNLTQAIGTGEQALGIYQAGVTTPLFFVPTQSMTMIIASSATSNDTLRRIAQMGTYPSTANPNFLLGPQMGVSEGGSLIFDVGPAQLNYSTSTATYSTAIGLRVDTMISAPAATQWWWTNGVLNTFTNSNIYTSTFSNYPVNFFFLGAYTNTVDGNRCYLGNIYEVLFYSNALTTSQRQAVEGYLANKWGFKASLVTTNPFRVYPPLVRSFSPTDIPGCSLWLDAADGSSMNSTTTVTSWSDKSGLGNTMTGTATWTGSNMSFNGSTQAFSNLAYVFPNSAYSMFAVYSNRLSLGSYNNAIYGNGGYPMLGAYSVPSVWQSRTTAAATNYWSAVASDYSGSNLAAAQSGTGAGTNYVYTSSNGGASWTAQTAPGASSTWNQIALTPDGTKLFIVNAGGAPWVGTNTAGTWSWGTLIGTTANWSGIACDSTGSNVITAIYSGALQTFVFNGSTWTRTLHTTGNWGRMASSSNGLNAIATLQDSTAVYMGVRTGGTWVWTGTNTGAGTGGVRDVASSASGANLAIVVSSGYIYTSSNFGVTWAQSTGAGSNTWYSIASSASGSNLIAGTASNIWIGAFDGSTWSWALQSSSPNANVAWLGSSSNGLNFIAGYSNSAGAIYTGTAPSTVGNVTARSVVANTGALGTTVGWAARIAGTTTSDDGGYAIATDSSGNVLVTGHYSAALTVYNQGPSGTAGTTLPLTGGYDCFIAKYSSAGAVVWAARITGTTTSQDIGRGIATDSSGNVLVTGHYGDALTVYNQGAAGTAGATLPFTGGSDVFVAKYSSAGAVVWAARIAGTTTSGDLGQAIATDSSGNVLVTGYYGDALTVYNQGAAGTAGATLPWTGGQDCFIAKYSSAGAVVWAAQIAGTTTSQDIGQGIATDSSGNVLVTGYYSAALTVYNQGGTAGTTLPFTGGQDCFIAKYSSAGAVVWAARIAGTTTSGDVGYGIATDSSGNVFVTGYYTAALTIYNQGPSGTAGTTLPFTGGQDCFIAKYSSDGAVVWAARIAGTTTSSEVGQAIATDSSGNVLVTGYYFAALTIYNQGPSGTAGATLPFTGGQDCFIAKYSSAGAVVWAARIAGTTTSADVGRGIATDSSGNVFVTGYYTAALTIYNQGPSGTAGTTLPFTGGYDCFVVKYNPDGYITAPTPASSNVLVSATYTPSTMSPFANGFTATTLAGTTLAATGIFVGGPLNYFNGSISELIIYGANLSAAQRRQVEGYLTNKWRLNSQIVAGHPYKLIPPGSVLPFFPTSITGCAIWLDGADNSTMNSTTTVTSWSDKSGLGNNMVGTATWSGSNLTFNGSTQAFSNTGYVFPNSAYSLFAVYSNTTAPASTAYMNAIYGNGGYPMLGVYGSNKSVSARSVVANTGALGVTVGWAAQIAGTTTSSDIGYGIAAGSNGNVLVTGQYGAALTLYNQGGTVGTTLPFTGSIDCFVANYSSNGTVSWAAQIASTGAVNDIGYGIATDSSGNVFVTGYYSAALTLYNTGGGTGATLPFTGGADCFVAKYSSAGAVVWAAQITGTTTSYDQGFGIATDSSGNVLVTGNYGAALTLYNTGGGTGATLPFTGGADCFVAKYSSAGAVVWAARIAGTTTSYDQGYGIATDSSGNVLVTGYYSAALTVYNQGGTAGTTLPFTGGQDCFIAKYSSAGAVVWAARIAGTGFDVGQGIITDSSGNVLVTGWYGAALTFYNQDGTAGITLPFTGGNDCFVAKYNPDGYITAPVPASSNVLVSATYTSATLSPFVNGSNASTLAGTTLAATGIFVGGPLNYFNGSISELLVYSNTLTTVQRRQVEGYLAQKWRIALPVTHPYSKFGPALA